MWLLWLASAQAASLDLLEVAGLFGTPTATDASAVYWNPAGLAMGSGTRFQIQASPTFGEVTVDLSDPTFGGTDHYTSSGVLPFIGLASDLGVDGLGVGLSLSVPIARSAVATELGGPGRYHLQDAGIQTMFASGALSYRVHNVAFGFAGSWIHSTWRAKTHTETLRSLADSLEAEGQETSYSDADLFDPNYSATLQFDDLTGQSLTLSGGLYVQASPFVGVGVSYIHGASLTHDGPMSIDFDCPPDEDAMGQFAAGLKGLCYAELEGRGQVAYDLPWRTHLGVRWTPQGHDGGLVVDAMGGLVGWQAFTDYNIDIKIDPSSVELDDAEVRKEVAATVSQKRQWARDNQQTFWAGLDVKGRVLDEKLLLGSRVLYDRSAVPSTTLAMNNFDTDTLMTSVLMGYRVAQPIELAVTLSQYWMAPREVSDSAFMLTLDEQYAADERYSYAPANGSYTANIRRISVDLRGHFGRK